MLMIHIPSLQVVEFGKIVSPESVEECFVEESTFPYKDGNCREYKLKVKDKEVINTVMVQQCQDEMLFLINKARPDGIGGYDYDIVLEELYKHK